MVAFFFWFTSAESENCDLQKVYFILLAKTSLRCFIQVGSEVLGREDEKEKERERHVRVEVLLWYSTSYRFIWGLAFCRSGNGWERHHLIYSIYPFCKSVFLGRGGMGWKKRQKENPIFHFRSNIQEHLCYKFTLWYLLIQRSCLLAASHQTRELFNKTDETSRKK